MCGADMGRRGANRKRARNPGAVRTGRSSLKLLILIRRNHSARPNTRALGGPSHIEPVFLCRKIGLGKDGRPLRGGVGRNLNANRRPRRPPMLVCKLLIFFTKLDSRWGSNRRWPGLRYCYDFASLSNGIISVSVAVPLGRWFTEDILDKRRPVRILLIEPIVKL